MSMCVKTSNESNVKGNPIIRINKVCPINIISIDKFYELYHIVNPTRRFATLIVNVFCMAVAYSRMNDAQRSNTCRCWTLVVLWQRGRH